MNSKSVATIGFLVATIWIAAVVASGAGWNPFPFQWSFANTGAFGDSFAPLSAIMAGVAALVALATFRAQQEEISRQKEREQVEDKRAAVSEFERSFFQFLDHYSSIRNSTDVDGANRQRSGQDAFRAIVTNYQRSAGELDVRWDVLYNKYENDLAHYFRFLYHVFSFIHSKTFIDRYFYARIVRSMLSESELLLLALNCAFGEGRVKFRPLVNEYSLLNNLSRVNIARFKLEQYFEDSAFNRIEES